MTNTALHFKTNSELIAELGQRLRQTRLSRNIPQEELARRAGIAVGAIKHIEAGQDIRLSTLVAVCRALDELRGFVGMFPPVDISPLNLMDIGHSRLKARRYGKKPKPDK